MRKKRISSKSQGEYLIHFIEGLKIIKNLFI